MESEPRAIDLIAGSEVIERVDMLCAAAREETRLARPLRTPKMPWRPNTIEDGGGILVIWMKYQGKLIVWGKISERTFEYFIQRAD